MAGILLLRLGSVPTFVGQPDPAPERWNALTAPFGDDLRGSCNAFLSLLAKSLLREGFRATGGIPLLNVTDVEPASYWYYDHHPPGVPQVTALAFALGDSCEGMARLVALLFSMATAAVLLIWCHRQFGLLPATAAAACLGALPAGMFWGTHLNYEVPTMPFVVGFLLAAVGQRRSLAIALLFAGFWMDLVAVGAALVLALDLLLTKPTRRKAALGWIALAFGLLCFWWLWKTIQTSRHGHTDAGNFVSHVLSVTFLSNAFDLSSWIRIAPAHIAHLLGGWPLAVLCLEFLVAVTNRSGHVVDRLIRVTTGFAILAFCAPAVRSADHPYYALYFLLPTALAFARFAHRLVTSLVLANSARWQPLLLGVTIPLAVLATGLIHDFHRPAPDPSLPACAVVGKELAQQAQEAEVAFVLETEAPFDPIVLAYYCERPVLKLFPGDPEGNLVRQGFLVMQGIPHARLILARDALWPGRGGYQDLGQ